MEKNYRIMTYALNFFYNSFFLKAETYINSAVFKQLKDIIIRLFQTAETYINSPFFQQLEHILILHFFVN